jgi:hypothetical protein
MPSCGALVATSRALLESRRSVTLAIRSHAPANADYLAAVDPESPIESQGDSGREATGVFLASGL